MFCTYAHYKPDGGLFYIGKGKIRRSRQMDCRNSHWTNIVNKYGKPKVEVLANWETEQEALDHERFLIFCFRDMGFVLANKTSGGEGLSGYKHTEESKQKNRLAKMGNIPWNKGIKGVMPTPWNKGKKTSAEVCEKLSLAKLGKPGHKKGWVNSEETRAKISASKTGKTFMNEAWGQAISKGNLGKKHGLVTCPHCGKIGGLTAMPRWHFDKCKFKGA
jgi:hypothetical protein